MSLYPVLQRYNFESNSQHITIIDIVIISCIQYYKGTILKAIHNRYRIFEVVSRLYPVLQRYNFESNSQLICVRIMNPKVVSSITKVQFWKQFTTRRTYGFVHRRLYPVLQRYNFESNSQRSRYVVGIWRVVSSITKVQFWKQFTTESEQAAISRQLYPVLQRYNFESNSQHNRNYLRAEYVVSSITKVQFWKQFTTQQED